MKLQALLGAGLLLGSISASAAYIDLPDSVTFDIRKSPSTVEAGALDAYRFDYDFSFDDGTPSTETHIPITRFYMESENYYGSIDGEGGFDVGNILGYFFVGAAKEYDLKEGKERITGPVLGETYKFQYDVTIYHFDIGCTTSCQQSNGSLTGSMFVSFFDSEQDIDVSVGPTAPLLAAGLAGLWMRKRKS